MMFEVAAFAMNAGTLACVVSGPTAMTLGVKPKPARKSTCSCVMSSCARRARDLGCDPRIVPANEFNLAAGDGSSVFVLKRRECGVERCTGGKRPGVRRNDADAQRRVFCAGHGLERDHDGNASGDQNPARVQYRAARSSEMVCGDSRPVGTRMSNARTFR